MATTGNVFAGTGENNAGIGATAWTSPGNIVSDNATDATCNAAASSQYLVARNFGFSIPTGALIQGVTFRVEASEHSSGTEGLNGRLQDDSGTLVGSSKSATISGTAKVVYTYGATNDTWGATLTPAIVNDADFGARFWFTTAHDVRIDFVTAAIEYAPPVTGTAAPSEGDDTSSASGSVSGANVTGTAAPTEAADTSAASGSLLYTGTAAPSEAADTGSASGSLLFTGTSAPSEAADTSAAAGELLYTGTSAAAEAADTSAAAGAVGSSEVTGSAAPTEAADTGAAAGALLFTGTVAAVEAADTASAAGVVLVTGTAAALEAADTAAAAGVVLTPVTGTAACVEAADTGAATGTAGVTEPAPPPYQPPLYVTGGTGERWGPASRLDRIGFIGDDEDEAEAEDEAAIVAILSAVLLELEEQ